MWEHMSHLSQSSTMKIRIHHICFSPELKLQIKTPTQSIDTSSVSVSAHHSLGRDRGVCVCVLKAAWNWKNHSFHQECWRAFHLHQAFARELMSGVHLLWKTILFGGNAFQHGMRFLWRTLGFVQLLKKLIKGFRMAEDDPMVDDHIPDLITAQLSIKHQRILKSGGMSTIFFGF